MSNLTETSYIRISELDVVANDPSVSIERAAQARVMKLFVARGDALAELDAEGKASELDGAELDLLSDIMGLMTIGMLPLPTEQRAKMDSAAMRLEAMLQQMQTEQPGAEDEPIR